LRTAVHAVAEDGSVALSFLNIILTTGLDSRVGIPESWFKDLPHYADIVLSPAHNLQVITVHNYLSCMDVLRTWVKL